MARVRIACNLSLFGNEGEQCIYAVFPRDYVSAQNAASRTFVNYFIVGCRTLDPRGLHEAATDFRPISWVYIYMLTPEAFRTVIGVAGSFHVFSAMLAVKILDTPLKFLFLHATEL